MVKKEAKNNSKMPELPDFPVPFTGGKMLSQVRQEWWDHLQVRNNIGISIILSQKDSLNCPKFLL